MTAGDCEWKHVVRWRCRFKIFRKQEKQTGPKRGATSFLPEIFLSGIGEGRKMLGGKIGSVWKIALVDR
jgi:hypothetical protein